MIEKNVTINNQILVHYMAQFFYSRSGASAIVIITDKPDALAGQYPVDTNLYVAGRSKDMDPVNDILKKIGSTKINSIEANTLTEEFLSDKILVCIDYLENKPSFVVHHFISKLANKALLSIVISSGKKIKLHRHSLRKSVYLMGMAKRLTHNIDKNESMIISGRVLNIKRQKFPLLPILAMIHVYNEADIIEATIKHLLTQGIDVHVIDNWSNDGSFEIVKNFAKERANVTFERYPLKNNNRFELGLMLSRVEVVAKQRPEYKWIMLNDADELRWSPWKNVSLQKALSFVDSLGYNAVDYTVFNFEPTNDGFSNQHDPEKFFMYGDFGKQSGNFVQVKTWKNNKEIDLASSGGHHAMFPNQRIYPLKFLLNHYPIRSNKQAAEKIFSQRVSRYSEEEKKKGWHTHYNKIKRSTKFIKRYDELILVNDQFYCNYLMELISGVGLEIKD